MLKLKNKNWPALFKLGTLPHAVAIGVSGGADSMALLHMLHQAQPPRLVALTVDHGLRTNSQTEAQNVAAYCATLNIEHHILHWTGDKPQTGVQAKARTARRQLLLDQCKILQITDLYLAHQANDQIETLLQRLARGSGPQGLSGMTAQTTQQGVTIHRPLLNVRRNVLRDYCLQHAIPFHDDPSNDDTRFERIRWRQMIDAIDQQQNGFTAGVLRSQKRLHAAATAVTVIAQDWCVAHVQSDLDKTVLPREAWARQPEAVAVEILRQLMVTDKTYRVDLDRLEEWVAQAVTDAPRDTALTLDRWWLQLKKDRLILQPAPPRHTPVTA